MQLLVILLYVVSALTVLTGLSVMCGTNKQSRLNTTWFFIATIGSAIWSVSIAIFLSLSKGMNELASFLVFGIILGITLTDVAILGYTSWNTKAGKIMTSLFAFFGLILVGILAFDHNVFYSSIELGGEFNKMITVRGWYFVALIIYFTLISLVFSSFLSKTIKKTKKKLVKIGHQVFMIGLSIGGILALIFDLILLEKAPNLVWIGPMAVSITILAFYYSVVRCRTVVMSASWMKTLSFIILLSFGASIYVLVFYIVFRALFRGPANLNPSPQILLLNLIMVAIVFCLLPAISEVYAFMKSFIATKEIDIGYVSKKLGRITKKTLDMKDLAGFLADHLHFEYVGFLINGRLYGSDVLDVSSDELVAIEKLSEPRLGIWQDIKPVSGICMKSDIKYVGELYNESGAAFGQIIIGHPVGKKVLDKKDLIEIEMVINLAASIINGEARKKA